VEEGRDQLLAFLEERLAFLLGEAGMRYDEVAAVAGACRDTLHPIDRLARAEALRSIRGNPDFLSLAVAAKRIRNILAQAREAGESPPEEVAGDDLEEPAERQLFRQSEALAVEARRMVQEQRYSDALSRIATLRPEVDRFFEEILVMDPDPGCRVRRLALLARVGSLLHSVVDFSAIVVEGEEAARDAVPTPRRNRT
jgi:glycyl-tRNA synthetase beta chain